MRNENRRVWSLQVEEGGIVQEVLRKQAGFTKKEISRAKFIPDGIRKNGTRCRVTEKTLPGDIIEILLETETQTSAYLAVNTEVLDILYEDQDLLAVNKPAGVVTHPQGGHYEDTLANQVSAYYAFRQESHTVRPIGRLDKDTSGIVLFAKNQTAAARLQKQRERGELQKTYLAVTEISVKWNDDTKKQEQGEIPVRREPFREHKNQTGNLKNIERTPEHTDQAEEKHKKDVEEKNKVEKFPGWSEIIRQMEEYETTADPDGWTRIDTPMAPDPENRLRMIPTPLGKPARTLYKSLWIGKANQMLRPPPGNRQNPPNPPPHGNLEVPSARRSPLRRRSDPTPPGSSSRLRSHPVSTLHRRKTPPDSSHPGRYPKPGSGVKIHFS